MRQVKRSGDLGKEHFWDRLKRDLKRNWLLWLMFLPVIVYYAVFSYATLYGVLIAFKDYSVRQGILGSDWVGLDHFKRFCSNYNFRMLVKNTLGLSLYGLIVALPMQIFFAICLHYLTIGRLKKSVQMVSYAPHFISNVILCGMLQLFMDKNSGVFNTIIKMLGGNAIDFLTIPEYFNDIYVWSDIWAGTGWGAIIYMSALAGVDMEMHEAAIIDGASKLQRILHIDLPSLKPMMVMLTIMGLGGLMNVGFEKVYLLQNDLNYYSSEIIATYSYRVGMIDGDFSYSTAIGLFNMLVNILILWLANTFSRKVIGDSLW